MALSELSDEQRALYILQGYEIRESPIPEWREWLLNGELHREDGPAIEWTTGDKEWWINGELHREDGPAYASTNGTKHWYKNGKRHRDDGPAVEYSDGTKWYYIHGNRVSEEEHRKVATGGK